MLNDRTNLALPLAVIEWLARISSIVSITLMALIFIGEPFRPSEISRNEWIGMAFFPLGVVIGIVIAWWNEGVGSVLTIGSLIGFYLIYGYLLRNPIGGWFIVFASPGLLFLLHWLLSSGERRLQLGSRISTATFQCRHSSSLGCLINIVRHSETIPRLRVVLVAPASIG